MVSKTNTVKLCVALKLGTPLSVTITLMKFVPGPCDSSGVQLNAPLSGLTVAFVGAPVPRLNVSAWVSTSLATFVKTSVVSS